MNPLTPTLLQAEWLVVSPDRIHGGGGLLFDGRVRAVAEDAEGVARLARAENIVPRRVGVLTPGLVNAHAHLELTGLRPERADTFRGWVDRIIALRMASPREERVVAVAAGAGRLIASGTTRVGDIDSTGCGLAGLAQSPIGGTLYREVLDAGDPERTAAVIESMSAPSIPGPRWRGGWSPHAPFTVSPELFAATGLAAGRDALR